MDKGTWPATVYRVTKSQTRLGTHTLIFPLKSEKTKELPVVSSEELTLVLRWKQKG